MKKMKQNTVVGLNSVKTQNNKGGINMKKFNLNYRDASLKHHFIIGGEMLGKTWKFITNSFKGTSASVTNRKVVVDLGEIEVIFDKDKKMSRFWTSVVDESGTKTIDPNKQETSRKEYQEYERIQAKMAEIGIAIHTSRTLIGNIKTLLQNKHSYHYNQDVSLRAVTFILNLLEAQKILDKKGEQGSSVLKEASEIMKEKKDVLQVLAKINNMAKKNDVTAKVVNVLIQTMGIAINGETVPMYYALKSGMVHKKPDITHYKINTSAIEKEVIRQEPLKADEDMFFKAELPKENIDISMDADGEFEFGDLEQSNPYYKQALLPTIVVDDSAPAYVPGYAVDKVWYVEKSDAILKGDMEDYIFKALDEKGNIMIKNGKEMVYSTNPTVVNNKKQTVSRNPYTLVRFYAVCDLNGINIQDRKGRKIAVEDAQKYITNSNYVRKGETIIAGFANTRVSTVAPMYVYGDDVNERNLDVGKIFYKQILLSRFKKDYGVEIEDSKKLFFKVRNSAGPATDIWTKNNYFANYRYFAEKLGLERQTVSYDFSSKNNYFSIASPAAENDYTAIASLLHNPRTWLNAPKRKTSTGMQFGADVVINRLNDEIKLDTKYGTKEYGNNFAFVANVEKQDGSTNPVGNPVLINEHTLGLIDRQDESILQEYGVIKTFFDNSLTKSIANAKTKVEWAYIKEIDKYVRINFVLPNDSRSGTESIQLNGTERMSKAMKHVPSTGKFDAVFYDSNMNPVIVEGQHMEGFVTLNAITIDITMNRNTDKRNTKVGSIQQRSWPSTTRIIFEKLVETGWHHILYKAYAYNIQNLLDISKNSANERLLKKAEKANIARMNSQISDEKYREYVGKFITIPSVKLNISSKEHVYVDSLKKAETLTKELERVRFFGLKFSFHKVVESYNSNFYLVKPLALMMTMLYRMLRGDYQAINLDKDVKELITAMQEMFGSGMVTRIPVLSGMGACVGSHLNNQDGVYLTGEDFVKLITEFTPTHSKGGRTHMKNLLETFDGDTTKAAEEFLKTNEVTVWASRDPDLGLTKEVPVLGIDNTIFGIGLTTSLALRLGWDFDGDIGKLKLISIDRK